MFRSRALYTFAVALATPFVVTLALAAGGDRWPIDRAHSRVTFEVTKWGFAEVEGRFREFTGEIAYNPARPEASHIRWSIKVASVDTGEPKRDQSLLAREYFDAARYPEITFDSSAVRKVSDRDLEVAGALTIRGVTRPMTVRASYAGRHVVPNEGTFDSFHVAFTINRYDFGVVGGSVLGPAISKEVKINLIAAAKQPSK